MLYCTYSCKLAVFTEKHFINFLLYLECAYVEAVHVVDGIIRRSCKLSPESQGCIIPGTYYGGFYSHDEGILHDTTDSKIGTVSR